jgi:ubiquinone/menaquinone biosynthesis C-methylase UbiE
MKISGFADTIEWYNQNAGTYASATLNTSSLDVLSAFVSRLPVGGKVLDAGCGAGRDTHLFKEKGLVSVGLDLSQGLLEEAQKRFPECFFVQGDFLHLPFNNNEFDGVWAHASLVHLETTMDVRKALGEFHRVLKNHGFLHVLVRAQTGPQKTAVVKDSKFGFDRFYQYFSLPELTTLLEESNFRIESIKQYNELEKKPNGRPDVEWIVSTSQKV